MSMRSILKETIGFVPFSDDICLSILLSQLCSVKTLLVTLKNYIISAVRIEALKIAQGMSQTPSYQE